MYACMYVCMYVCVCMCMHIVESVTVVVHACARSCGYAGFGVARVFVRSVQVKVLKQLLSHLRTVNWGDCVQPNNA